MELVSKSFGTFFNVVSFRTLVKVLGSVTLATLVWEHVGRKRESDLRPSVGLSLASEKSVLFFNRVGSGLAWLSSYLTQVDLKDVGVTVRDVGKPTFDLVTSPLHTLSGYVKKAHSYQNKQWMVYVGSGIAVVLALAGYYKYSNFLPTSSSFRMPRFLTSKSF
ncbi:putative ORFan [Tupanvirus deep ocean]|uniref:ORFan n=2 Tax=Tupanvirus TaxID=2094720 RepID=A0AC62A8I9_9VIRU|nr:putative ORFan [Tupanvirus deep ocean]QKU33973.1 putative ORFan [Tupanvirus deep ocean]